MREILALRQEEAAAARLRQLRRSVAGAQDGRSPDAGDPLPARPGARARARMPQRDLAELRDFARERPGPARPAGLGPAASSARSSRKRAMPSASRRSSSTSPRPRCWPACSRSSRRCSRWASAATARRSGTPAWRSTASSAAATLVGAVLPRPVRAHRQARRRLDGRRARPLAAARRRRGCRRRWRTWSATSRDGVRRQAGAADARRRDHAVPRVRPRPAPHADAGGRARVSGISGVEWDAVELPSQFMENFCWEWDVLQHMTAHVDTGEPLPRELFDKMLAARHFQSGAGHAAPDRVRAVRHALHTEPSAAQRLQAGARRGARRSGGARPPPLQPLSAHLLAHLSPAATRPATTATSGPRC